MEEAEEAEEVEETAALPEPCNFVTYRCIFMIKCGQKFPIILKIK